MKMDGTLRDARVRVEGETESTVALRWDLGGKFGARMYLGRMPEGLPKPPLYELMLQEHPGSFGRGWTLAAFLTARTA